MGDRIFIESQMDAFVSLLGAPRIRTSDGKVSIPFGSLECDLHHEIIPDALWGASESDVVAERQTFRPTFSFLLGSGFGFEIKKRF